MSSKTTATVNPYPWLVAFVRYRTGSTIELVECAGTLVAPAWVLTAAHAVIDPHTTTALIGPARLSDCPVWQMTTIETVVPFPCYDGTRPRPLHDLALVKLAGTSAVEPVTLAEAPAGTNPFPAEALGWGDANARSSSFSDTVKVVQLQAAAKIRGMIRGIHDDGATQTCYGDSGGPLLLRNGGARVQVGVTSCMSFERECRKGSNYTALTRPYLDWIGGVTSGALLATSA